MWFSCRWLTERETLMLFGALDDKVDARLNGLEIAGFGDCNCGATIEFADASIGVSEAGSECRCHRKILSETSVFLELFLGTVTDLSNQVGDPQGYFGTIDQYSLQE